MLSSLIAITLCLAPSDLDLSPRRTLEVSTPVTAEPSAPVEPGWATPPMVSAEGRTARLLGDAQLERLHAIDDELARFSTLPSRVVGVLGGLAASTPLLYATVFAFVVVGELASYSAVTLLFSMFTFPIGFAAGLLAVPVWGWVLAAVGVVVVAASAAVTSHLEHHRAELLAERKALIDSTKSAPIDATSLITVGTF